MLNLNLSDVDLTTKTVLVRETKNGEERNTYFGVETLRALRAYLKVRKGLGEALWISRNGTRYSGTQLDKVVRQAAKLAGLQGVHIHTLRHTCCTLLLYAGLPLHEVQKLMGHSSIEMTAWYAHTFVSGAAERYLRCSPVDNLKKIA